MRSAILGLSVIMLLDVCAGDADAARGRRRACKESCQPMIAQQCRGFGRPYRQCKKGILRTCRRTSVESCSLTPSSVTTTTIATGTTSPKPTTTLLVTTTTTRAPTTSTTLALSYGGQWYFAGTLSSDTCGGADFYLDANVYVTHSPGSSSVSVKIGSAATMYGSADTAGFEAGESHYSDSGCLVATAILAERTSNASAMGAGIGIDIDCGFDSCRAIWVGDLSR